MRLRLTISPMSRSATSIPSPSRKGGARCTPSGETIAVQQPPRKRLAHTIVGRDGLDLLIGEPARRIDHETARLERVMTDRHLHLVGEDLADHRARELRRVDLLALRHQGVAGQGIVMFPAGERADAADRGVDDLEARAVALAPDHAFVKRRGDLAALQHHRAIGIEDQLRIVERAAVALVDTEDHDHAVLARRGRDRVADRTGIATASS